MKCDTFRIDFPTLNIVEYDIEHFLYGFKREMMKRGVGAHECVM